MKLNALQLLHLEAHVGVPAAVQPQLAAIGLAESEGGAHPRGDSYPGQGYTSFGVWQIHTRDDHGRDVNLLPGGHRYNEHRLVVDITYNARAALYVWRSQGLNAWSTHLHAHHQPPAYLAWMPAVRWALGHDRRLAARAHHRHTLRAHHAHPHPHARPKFQEPILEFALMFAGLALVWSGMHLLHFTIFYFRRARRLAARAEQARERKAELALARRRMPRAARRVALS